MAHYPGTEPIKGNTPIVHNITPLISLLFHSQVQAHIYHLQTDSYAQHKALNDYYDAIPDMIDSIVESFQGEYGIQRGYKSQPFLEDNSPIPYFENILWLIPFPQEKYPSP